MKVHLIAATVVLSISANAKADRASFQVNHGSPVAAPGQFNGQTIPSGQVVIAFASPSVPSGALCQNQFRQCSNGKLSLNYAYSSCQISGD